MSEARAGWRSLVGTDTEKLTIQSKPGHGVEPGISIHLFTARSPEFRIYTLTKHNSEHVMIITGNLTGKRDAKAAKRRKILL